MHGRDLAPKTHDGYAMCLPNKVVLLFLYR